MANRMSHHGATLMTATGSVAGAWIGDTGMTDETDDAHDHGNDLGNDRGQIGTGGM